MNKTEKLANQWLQSQGYKDIVFRHSKTPDFLVDEGKLYEVKTQRNKSIYFSASQYQTISRYENVDVLVYDWEQESCVPETIIPFNEIRWGLTRGKSLWGIYHITYGIGSYKTVKLEKPQWLQFKSLALERDKTLQALVGEAIDEYFANRKGG